jgi:hypothetical protein
MLMLLIINLMFFVTLLVKRIFFVTYASLILDWPSGRLGYITLELISLWLQCDGDVIFLSLSAGQFCNKTWHHRYKTFSAFNDSHWEEFDNVRSSSL